MIIAVDFDGTIVTHEYPAIGQEIPFAIQTLKMLQEHHQLILWSVREGNLLQEAVQWCENQGVHFYAINSNHPDETTDSPTYSRKIIADIYIDDRNFNGGTPDWTHIYQTLTNQQETKENAPYDAFLVECESNIFVRFGRWIERIKREINRRK